jgi:small subunit ribosomal protein S18
MPSYKNRKCFFTDNNITYVDYKNTPLLRRFLTKYFKIVPKYYSGTNLKMQKRVSKAIKQARYMALIPYTN